MSTEKTEQFLKWDREHVIHSLFPIGGELPGIVFDKTEGILVADTEGKEYIEDVSGGGTGAFEDTYVFCFVGDDHVENNKDNEDGNDTDEGKEQGHHCLFFFHWCDMLTAIHFPGLDLDGVEKICVCRICFLCCKILPELADAIDA